MTQEQFRKLGVLQGYPVFLLLKEQESEAVCTFEFGAWTESQRAGFTEGALGIQLL